MSAYWFFDLAAVAERNLFLSQLVGTESARDATFILAAIRRGLRVRPAARIPLD
jgi:hypothetical protein